MTKEFFNNLLKYNQNLIDPDFLRSVLRKITQRNKKRNNIIVIFTILGALTSLITLMVLKPSFGLLTSYSYITTIGVASFSAIVMYAVYEEW